ncbi:hypothetical protein [Arthrobacter sp. 2MCAF14]|uniref:hypothetical protein n=1 Tax=Arthrobacter sp. 2MCAF14 TaxID=3232982 RepID=UPI003F903CA3
MKLIQCFVRWLGGTRAISAADAVAIIALAGVVALIFTMTTVADIVGRSSGSVTLSMPLESDGQDPLRLGGGATARYTRMEAAIPALPETEVTLLLWSSVLNLVGVLAVAGLVVLVTWRLWVGNLFTAGSAALIAACGAVLALAGSAGQILDSTARNRLAELIGANPRFPGESVVYVTDFNVVPLVAGASLVLIAGVFQFGRKLQKDTEGLV